MRRPLHVIFVLALAAALLAGCGGSSSSNNTSSSGKPSTITVFAAASLTDAFDAIKTGFEEENPDTIVTFNYAGSNTLAQQIQQGAPADVFASADTENMDEVKDLVDTPKPFTTNTLVVIVPAANPGKITNLHDLAKEGVTIAVGDPSVPVGNYTLEVLDKMAASPDYGPKYKAGVKKNFVTQETSVRNILQKVQLGEVDAGYVYVSDAFSAGDEVKSIEIPADFNIKAEYPIATVKNSTNPDAAQSFMEYVLSPAGQKTLKDNGFPAG